MLSTLFCLAVLHPAQDSPVQLARVFHQGEKDQYVVKAALQVETRPYGLQTFLPQDVDISYKFNTEVKAMKADGICEMEYHRPTITQVEGETANTPPRTTVEKLNMNALLTVSPINEILQMKDLNPPKKDKGGGGRSSLALTKRGTRRSAAQDIGQFIGEVFRLSAFVGGFDSGLDFNPKLPYDAVKVGETWKRTVGYSPQKMGATGKSAVQRLDYLYTYKGLVDVEGQKFQRVTVDLKLDTNVADYINQIYGKEQTGLRGIKLKLNGSIDFDLDPKSFKTIRAVAKSEASVSIEVTEVPSEPVQEQHIKGTTTMSLIASK